MSEFEPKMEAIANSTIHANVTNLSGVPSWMLVLVNHIPPQSGRSGDDHCVVLVEFYFFQTADTRIFLTDIFQRYEFIENTVINHQQHSRIVRVVLCAILDAGTC